MFISNSRPSNLGVGVSALILKTCMQCKRQSANVHHWSSLHIPFHSLSFFSVALPYLKCYYFTSAYVLNIYIPLSHTLCTFCSHLQPFDPDPQRCHALASLAMASNADTATSFEVEPAAPVPRRTRAWLGWNGSGVAEEKSTEIQGCLKKWGKEMGKTR